MRKPILLLLFLLAVPTAEAQSYVDQYNVVWNSFSRNSGESMPCGGGDIGLNVWVEEGDLLFYLSRSGAFDENNTLLKLGRVRLRLTPNVLEGKNFRQELKLRDGYVRIEAGEGNDAVGIDLWVDVFRPVIHLEVSAQKKVSAEVFYENWRYRDRELRKTESNQNSYKWAAPKGLQTKADRIAFEEDGVLFFHRNEGESVFDVAVNQQGMDAVIERMTDPLKNRTSGGFLTGENMEPAGTGKGEYVNTDYGSWHLRSRRPSPKHSVQIYLHVSQTETLEEWKEGLQSIRRDSEKVRNARKQTCQWWNRYWERSFIVINPDDPGSEGWRIGRNYQLFRYLLGCNAFGEWPTKFNGGLFTYDPVFTDEKYPFTPDFRNWGGGTHTAQNQRLVYFPMLKSGDSGLMIPQFEYYNRTLNNAELRSEVYWGHRGASFTEQLENYGLPNPSEYGWKRPADYDKGMEYNAWLEYQWDTVLEFCLMILETGRYAGADVSTYLPLIESCLTFFDEHYRYLAKQRGVKELNEHGELVIYPGSACETYKMAYNATSTIAALQTVTDALLALDGSLLPEEKRERWEKFRSAIPDYSFRSIDGGKRMIAPARMWERKNNTETPQLYPVFPWRQYGVGRPDLETAVNTYQYDPDALEFRHHQGWKQDAVWAACLGLTDEAKSLMEKKLGDSGRRFPAFWGPGFDWTPDHNWGGSGMIALQEMVLQEAGGNIFILPAWPGDWDVHFRLHAPGQTTVEVKVQNGKPVFIQTFPEARKSDIVFKE